MRLPYISIAAFIVLGVSACERAETPVEPTADNLIIILIDALRPDHLGAYGYARPTSPNIDALAADATRFDKAITVAPWTLPAMGTLWTSLYPSVHKANRPGLGSRATRLGDSFTTLAEVLQANQLRTSAHVDTVYGGATFGFAQGFELFGGGNAGLRMSVEALLGWLDREKPSRFFAYLHTSEVHAPYQPRGGFPASPADDVSAEERQRYLQVDFDPGYSGPLDGSTESIRRLEASKSRDEGDVRHLVALYDRGIVYVDHWVGQLIQGLRERGLYDRSAIVITADHGEEFLDHGRFDHSRTYYDEMLRVPLVVRVPNEGRGRAVAEQVGLIDIMPTALDLLAVSYSGEMQGRSFRPLLVGKGLPQRTLFAEASQDPKQKAASRTNSWKYVETNGGSQLYDLQSDPDEKADLCHDQASRCRSFSDELRAWRDQNSALSQRMGSPTAPRVTLDGAERERLRALGYDK